METSRSFDPRIAAPQQFSIGDLEPSAETLQTYAGCDRLEGIFDVQQEARQALTKAGPTEYELRLTESELELQPRKRRELKTL